MTLNMFLLPLAFAAFYVLYHASVVNCHQFKSPALTPATCFSSNMVHFSKSLSPGKVWVNIQPAIDELKAAF